MKNWMLNLELLNIFMIHPYFFFHQKKKKKKSDWNDDWKRGYIERRAFDIY